jgi:hypothetical protein
VLLVLLVLGNLPVALTPWPSASGYFSTRPYSPPRDVVQVRMGGEPQARVRPSLFWDTESLSIRPDPSWLAGVGRWPGTAKGLEKSSCSLLDLCPSCVVAFIGGF